MRTVRLRARISSPLFWWMQMVSRGSYGQKAIVLAVLNQEVVRVPERLQGQLHQQFWLVPGKRSEGRGGGEAHRGCLPPPKRISSELVPGGPPGPLGPPS